MRFLGVYLKGETESEECICSECGHRYIKKQVKTYYLDDITHNLGEMAEVAGIYKYLWRPEELGITKAYELIGPLSTGLEELKAKPERFKKYDAPTSWGRYEHLVNFVENYLKACKQHHEANVVVSR